MKSHSRLFFLDFWCWQNLQLEDPSEQMDCSIGWWYYSGPIIIDYCSTNKQSTSSLWNWGKTSNERIWWWSTDSWCMYPPLLFQSSLFFAFSYQNWKTIMLEPNQSIWIRLSLIHGQCRRATIHLIRFIFMQYQLKSFSGTRKTSLWWISLRSGDANRSWQRKDRVRTFFFPHWNFFWISLLSRLKDLTIVKTKTEYLWFQISHIQSIRNRQEYWKLVRIISLFHVLIGIFFHKLDEGNVRKSTFS